MGRGRDPGGAGGIDSVRRKQTRRAGAARAQQAHRERLRATACRNARRFLSPATSVARRQARAIGSEVRVERTGGGGGWRGRARWAEAIVELVGPGVSLFLSPGDRSGSGGTSTIDVRIGRRRVSVCPPEIIQSGDRRAFVEWLDDALSAAAERARKGK